MRLGQDASASLSAVAVNARCYAHVVPDIHAWTSSRGWHAMFVYVLWVAMGDM